MNTTKLTPLQRLAFYHLDASIIKEIRKKLGLTQQEIADKLNIDKSYYSRKESGRIPFKAVEMPLILDVLEEIDEKLGQFILPSLIGNPRSVVITAREGMGKSFLAHQLSKEISKTYATDTDLLVLDGMDEIMQTDGPGDDQQILPEYPEVRHYIRIINEAAIVNDLEMINFAMTKTLKLLQEKYNISLHGHRHTVGNGEKEEQ